MHPLPQPETADCRWQSLYKFGGVAAPMIAVLLLGEIVIYVVFPRPSSVAEHFALFQHNWLAGLLTLDLLGMICYLLFIPLMLALYMALRRTSESMMAVATVLFFLGIADFFATNTAFPVLSLNNQYAAATTETERAMVLAAGQAMFTLFNENAFLVSYVIVSAAWVMVAGVMLRSSLFSRTTAIAGIISGAAGIVAVVLEHLPGSETLLVISISLYFGAIVFLFLWVVLTGLRLYQFGSVDSTLLSKTD